MISRRDCSQIKDSFVPTVPSVPKQKKPPVGQHPCDSRKFKQNRISFDAFGLETRLKKGPPATAESPQVFPSVPNIKVLQQESLSNASENSKNTPKWGVFGAAGQIRTADLILTKDALYLLSYSSIWRPRWGSNPRPPA